MALHFAHRLGKVVVHGVGGIVRVVGRRADNAGFLNDVTQSAAKRSVVRQIFRDDVARARKRGVGARNALFLADVRLRQRFKGGRGVPCAENGVGERLQTLFPRHGRTGAALGAVGAVDVVERGKSCGVFDGGGKLRCQLALRVDGVADLGLAGFETAQIGEPLREHADGLVVHRAVHFLAVTRDKGHGIALIEKFYNVCNVLLVLLKLSGERFDHIHKGFS